MSRPRRSTTLAASILVATAASWLTGCAASDRGKDDDEGELREVHAELRDRVFRIDSTQWKAFVRHGSEEKSLPIASLQSGSHYGIDDAEFLFVARDGKYEILVDTVHLVGRVRVVDTDATTGLVCNVMPLEQWNRTYECTPRGTPLEKFSKFDAADINRARGAVWLPSTPGSAQTGLVDKVIARVGAKRLQGVTGTDGKCTVEVERGDVSGDLRVDVFQVKDNGESRKLAGFEATEGAVLGAIESRDFIALQSQVRSPTNDAEIRDRKLLVHRTDRDGLKIEIITSDNGASAGKHCRKLEPVD